MGSEAGLLGFEYTLSQLAVCGSLYFPKLATAASPISRAVLESSKRWRCPSKTWRRQFLLPLNLGRLLQPTEHNQSHALWPLRQTRINLVHFYLVLWGHSLWESSHHTLRKPKQPIDRPTQKGTVAPGSQPWLIFPVTCQPYESSWKWILQPPQWAVLRDTI